MPNWIQAPGPVSSWLWPLIRTATGYTPLVHLTPPVPVPNAREGALHAPPRDVVVHATAPQHYAAPQPAQTYLLRAPRPDEWLLGPQHNPAQPLGTEGY